MRRIIRLDKKPYFLSYASAGGYEEKCGPLGDFFDISSEDDLFGQRTAEEAESEMARRCLNTALKKCALSHSALDVLLAGDLERDHVLRPELIRKPLSDHCRRAAERAEGCRRVLIGNDPGAA